MRIFVGIEKYPGVSTMSVTIDHKTEEKSYGYTRDNQGNIWYWNFDGENLEFRDYGYPIEHPYKETGKIPNNVKELTRTFLDL